MTKEERAPWRGVVEIWAGVVELAQAQALDAIREVGHGGHFFGAAHTLERYESAFYAPLISDWRNFESWQEAGSPDATRKANKVYKQMLAEYQAPA